MPGLRLYPPRELVCTMATAGKKMAGIVACPARALISSHLSSILVSILPQDGQMGMALRGEGIFGHPAIGCKVLNRLLHPACIASPISGGSQATYSAGSNRAYMFPPPVADARDIPS